MKCPHYYQEGLPKELFAWCKQHNYPCGKQAKGECDCMLCDMVWNAALSSAPKQEGFEECTLQDIATMIRVELEKGYGYLTIATHVVSLIDRSALSCGGERVALELHREYCDYITDMIAKHGYDNFEQPEFTEWLQSRISARPK